MFGFRGHWPGRFDIDTAGVAVTTTRDFSLQGSHCLKTLATNEKFNIKFDIDNINVVKPDQLLRHTFGAIANDNREFIEPIVLTAQNISGSIGNINIATGAVTYFQNTKIGWRYTSNAALSPANRKNRVSFPRPDLQEYFGLHIIDAVTVNTAANNLAAAGNLELDFQVFPNLKYLYINGTFATSINLKFPKRLESFQFHQPVATLSVFTGRLPASIKQIIVGALGTVSNIDVLIQDCVNCTVFCLATHQNVFSGFINNVANLVGALNISHMTALKTFILPQNNSLNSLTLPSGNSAWEWFATTGWNASLRGSFNTNILTDVLQSPLLRAFFLGNCQLVWAKNFTNADFVSTLRGFWIAQNSISGTINLTDTKASIREFKTGNLTNRGGAQLNSHSAINITGLTGVITIDITGSDCADLQLPVNTVCQTLALYDNKLDIVTNPNLLTQINAMTAVTSCLLGNTANPTGGTIAGQNSTNGIGANPNFSSLINCTVLSLMSCKASGTLTLVNINKISSLYCAANQLTGITNFTAQISLATLVCHSNPDLVFSIPNTFLNLSAIAASSTKAQTVDLSGKTSTTSFAFLSFNSCTQLTSFTFPSTQARCVIQLTNTINFSGCTLLSSITNSEFINYTSSTGTADTRFTADNCALNQSFPIGQNNFIPRTIVLQNNGISQANLNSTIDSMYTNRTKWNGYTSAKTANFGGTNSAPSGILQAPPGFVLGSNDGTPTSAKEQIYVLINNYGWSIATN